MKHPVVGPAQLLMGAYLELGRIRSLEDLASGLFIVTLFYQYESFSKRLVPEAVNLLMNAVLLLAPSEIESKSDLPDFGFFPDLWKSVHRSIRLRDNTNIKPRPANLSSILSGSADNLEQTKVDLLAVSLMLLKKFGDLYQKLDGAAELLGGMHTVVTKMKLQSYSPELQEVKRDCEALLARHLKLLLLARKPLLLQSHKPIPIATYTPKFSNSNSSYLRAQDPDRDRATATKLKREYKQEKKGALRELRRDAQFLARQQQKRQAEKDEAYNLSMRRALGSIEIERAEEKKMQKEKLKEKKRAGRK